VRQRCTKRSCALHRPRMNFAWTSPSRLCSKSLPHKPCVRACVRACRRVVMRAGRRVAYQ
jgi:hypothetical protein